MPTAKQKKIAKAIIENSTLDKPKTGGEIVESSGYGESMSLYPKRILESEGVKEALNDFGFNENNAKRVVARILLDEEVDPGNRLRASQEVFKVHGSYAPEKSTSINLNIDKKVENKEMEDLRLEFEEKLKAKLLQ